MAGDVFQLGDASWRVLQVTGGTVRVDAHAGAAEHPVLVGRGASPERRAVAGRQRAARGYGRDAVPALQDAMPPGLSKWSAAETGAEAAVAEQAVEYLAASSRALSMIPWRETLVLERFLRRRWAGCIRPARAVRQPCRRGVGSRVAQKRFCRRFNFELPAAGDRGCTAAVARRAAFVPAVDVFRYLHRKRRRDVLVQAFLDAPVFDALALEHDGGADRAAQPRRTEGRPQLQRMLADDLMAAVFPTPPPVSRISPQSADPRPSRWSADDRRLPAGDQLEGLRSVLVSIHHGADDGGHADTPEPSVFAHEILNAKPYAFLDDARYEARAQAVITQHA